MKINNRINQSLGAKTYDRPLSAIKNIIWHYTAVPRASRAFITGHENYWRNTLGWNRGGYAYYIDADGNIYQNYPLTMMTWGAGWVNPFSVHISVEAASANDYSQAQVNARNWLTRKLMAELNLDSSQVLGHKEVGSTSCPGYSITQLNNFRSNLSASSSRDLISTVEVPKKQGKKSSEVVAQEVINGVWGNDPARSNSLRKSGYNPNTIQTIVNRILNSREKKSNTPVKRSNSQVAQEVIKGLWGDGDTRKSRLQAAGYNFNSVQNEVNRILGGGTTKKAPVKSAPKKKSTATIVNEVIAGKWGTGNSRFNKLKKAGYNPTTIQNAVNKKLGATKSAPKKKSIDTVAREVIAGQWGNGNARSNALKKAGYDANAVQRRVNQLL